MIIGLVFAIFAGVLLGVQNIFNRHLNVHVSGWAATAFVLLTGSLASLIFGLIFEGTALFQIGGLPTAYFFFGFVGIGVVYSILSAMKKLGPTKAIIISVIAQLTCSVVFDAIGLLSLPQVAIQWQDIAGLLLMFVGIFIFSYEKKVTNM